uniref:Uncharacterized protein n=1 Tax=Salix viminalis TaxID=40686 RepID=A0A6N2KHJ2_SALVM
MAGPLDHTTRDEGFSPVYWCMKRGGTAQVQLLNTKSVLSQINIRIDLSPRQNGSNHHNITSWDYGSVNGEDSEGAMRVGFERQV